MTKHDDLAVALHAALDAQVAAQAEYDAAVASVNTLTADNTTLTQANATLTTNLNTANSNLAAAQAALTKAQADLTAANAEIARLNAIISGGGGTPTTPPLPAGWTKTLFADYFDGSAVDTTKWNVRNGTTQSNMNGMNFAANCTVANGMLSIRSGKNGTNTTYPWTCGYLDTIGKASFQFGRWEARVRVPWGTTAAGFWPAFWLRPDDGGLGELDIMEAWPTRNQISQTIWRDYTGTAHYSGKNNTSIAGFDPNAWHTYAVEKELGAQRFYVDNVLVWDASKAATWNAEAFDRSVKWNIRLNLQMGGSWGGTPTASTDLTRTYDVDYVRVLGR